MKQIDNHRIERLFFLIFIFLFALNLNIFAQSIKVNIGSDTILLPSNIGGFSEIHKIEPNVMKNFGDNFTPPQNELLGLYVSESDLGILFKGELPAYKRFIMVQVTKAIKDQKIDKTQFVEFEKTFEESLYKSLSTSDKETVSLFNNQSEKLMTKENIAFKIELGKMISLGTFVKNDEYTISSYLSKILMEFDGKPNEYIQCGGVSLIHIKNKVIFVYINSNYDNITDLDWVRSLSKDICDRITQLNLQPEKASSQTADEYFELGLIKTQNNDLTGGISDYTNAIKINPMFLDAYFRRGICKGLLEDNNGAIYDFTKVITINPKSSDSYLSRGIAKNAIKDYKGAIYDFTKAIELNPANSLNAYVLRGMSNNCIKNLASAMFDFTKAIGINPNHALSYLERGKIKVYKDDWNGAILDFSKNIELNPKSAEAYYFRGLCRYQLTLFDRACKDWRKAADLGYKEAYTAIKDFCH